MYKITWAIAAKNDSILNIEDPLHGGPIEKMVYYQIYSKILDELNGETMSDYFDFYFQESPLNKNCWIFLDDDSKEDFLDWCQEKEILPSLKEIHSGETYEEKIKREQKERTERLRQKHFIELQRKKFGEKKKRAQLNVEFNKRKQILLTVEKLKEKLKAEKELDKIEKIKCKLEKTIKLLDSTI